MHISSVLIKYCIVSLTDVQVYFISSKSTTHNYDKDKIVLRKNNITLNDITF